MFNLPKWLGPLSVETLTAEMQDFGPENYKARIEAENELWLYGESVKWDREKMVDYCASKFILPRKSYERSYDSGKMKRHAEIYRQVGINFGFIKGD